MIFRDWPRVALVFTDWTSNLYDVLSQLSWMLFCRSYHSRRSLSVHEACKTDRGRHRGTCEI
jgi:hypothetical protein